MIHSPELSPRALAWRRYFSNVRQPSSWTGTRARKAVLTALIFWDGNSAFFSRGILVRGSDVLVAEDGSMVKVIA